MFGFSDPNLGTELGFLLRVDSDDCGLGYGDDYDEDRDCDVDVEDFMSSVPLFRDSLRLEGRPVLGDWSDGVDVGWEEIDGCVDERELLSVIFDVDEGGLRGDDSYGLDVMDPGWEVVYEETTGSPVFFHDDDEDFAEFYAVEYEPMFVQPEDSSLGMQPASKSALETLDTTTVALTPDEDVLDCAICKDSMSDGEQATKMPCYHIYHRDCIRKWLQIRNTCPVCRFALPEDEANCRRT